MSCSMSFFLNVCFFSSSLPVTEPSFSDCKAGVARDNSEASCTSCTATLASFVESPVCFRFRIQRFGFRPTFLVRLTLITFPSAAEAENEEMWPGKLASESKFEDILHQTSKVVSLLSFIAAFAFTHCSEHAIAYNTYDSCVT
ncbi:hypothetical protein BJV82DRAFT_220967 [Fennellomyces sp. T-0311]|nr:hypothetical protein BJV82DRAFT_220967 [Fennellomyces sp. T-0311]